MKLLNICIPLLAVAFFGCQENYDIYEAMKTAYVEEQIIESFDSELDSTYTDKLLVGFVDDVVFNIYEVSDSIHWYQGFQVDEDSVFTLFSIYNKRTNSFSEQDRSIEKFESKLYRLGDDNIEVYKIPDYGWFTNVVNLKPQSAKFYSRQFGYLGSISKKGENWMRSINSKNQLNQLIELIKEDGTFYNWEFPDRFIVNKYPREKP